jgi:rRNA-processing protein CGR1
MTVSSTKTKSEETLAKKPEVIRGRNVSGRSWKAVQTKRTSALVKTAFKNQSKTWEQRQAEKQLRKETLELEKQLREERVQGLREKNERRLENERRRAENEYESAKKSAQTLNTSKLKSTLKAMSKKQLRQIKKTRMNTKTGAVEFVPAYSK